MAAKDNDSVFYTVKLGKLYVMYSDKLETVYFGTYNIQEAEWYKDPTPAMKIAEESGGDAMRVDITVNHLSILDVEE